MKNINLPKKKNMIKEQDETLVEKSNKKVNKYYEVYKILSNVEYELGKSVFDFIENFKEKYKDAKNNDNTNTREIMIDIIKMIESTTNILNCNHHINNENDNFLIMIAIFITLLLSNLFLIKYIIIYMKYMT